MTHDAAAVAPVIARTEAGVRRATVPRRWARSTGAMTLGGLRGRSGMPRAVPSYMVGGERRGSRAAPQSPRPCRTLAVLAAIAGLAGCRERKLEDEHASAPAAHLPAAPISAAPSKILYPSAPGSFADLVTGVRHAVVAIRAGAPVRSGPAAMFPGTPETWADVALGTGFLVESQGIYVLTNDHIAAASATLHVVLPDRRDLPARLIGRDLRLDLALLAIDLPPVAPSPSAPGDASPSITASAGSSAASGTPSAGSGTTSAGSGTASAGSAPRQRPASPPPELRRLSPLPLGNSDDLQVGEWLVVLGNPFGDEVTASVGVVSATGREIAGSLVPGRAMSFRTFLQTDARIHRGNSGGPVIDTAGQVVGVAVATSDRPGEISFAIPINRVKEVIDALRDNGKVARSWLGVLVQPVDAERAATAGLARPSGALVTEVKHGSPAARAGLRVHDVIVQWGDREVDHRSLPWIVAQTPAGKPINAIVWRNRAQTQLAIVVESMPE